MNLTEYPDDTGITGKVFKENHPILSFVGKREPGFHEIDNIGEYVEIHDFLFAPTYGFNNVKNGIIQVFNKKGGTLNENDIKTLKPYQKLVGMLIENTLELNKAIDLDINFKRILDMLGKKTDIFNKDEIRFTTSMEDRKSVV